MNKLALLTLKAQSDLEFKKDDEGNLIIPEERETNILNQREIQSLQVERNKNKINFK